MKYRIVLWMCHEVSLSLGVRVLHFLTSYLSVMLIRWLLWHQTECSADIKHWSVIQTSFNLSVSCAHSILSVYLHIMLWHVARPRIYSYNPTYNNNKNNKNTTNYFPVSNQMLQMLHCLSSAFLVFHTCKRKCGTHFSLPEFHKDVCIEVNITSTCNV